MIKSPEIEYHPFHCNFYIPGASSVSEKAAAKSFAKTKLQYVSTRIVVHVLGRRRHLVDRLHVQGYAGRAHTGLVPPMPKFRLDQACRTPGQVQYVANSRCSVALHASAEGRIILMLLQRVSGSEIFGFESLKI